MASEAYLWLQGTNKRPFKNAAHLQIRQIKKYNNSQEQKNYKFEPQKLKYAAYTYLPPNEDKNKNTEEKTSEMQIKKL